MSNASTTAATLPTESTLFRTTAVQPYSNHIPKNKLFSETLKDSIAEEIVSTRAFQRLRDISFLGAISYVRNSFPENEATKESRYNHSLGVAEIAETFSHTRGLPRHARLTVVAAGLLHDIGHPPLSHSAESALAERFGDNHHSMTERLIRGGEKMAADIPRILLSNGVDPENVIALLNGELQIGGADLFGGPFNIDTLEGISRCSLYMSKTTSESLPPPELVLAAIESMDDHNSVSVLDCFWRSKDRVYNTFIRSPLGILADKIADDYFRLYRGKIDRSIMLGSESDLWGKHKKLYERLYSFVRGGSKNKRTIKYIKRTFVVNEDISARNLRERYTHVKTPQALEY